MAETVTISLSLATYNKLRDMNTELVLENKELRDAIEELQERDGQKVIIRETYTYEDEDGDVKETRSTSVKCFDEVKAEVEEFYKGKFKELEEKSKSWEQTADELLDKVFKMKHRNLWQRIWNK